MSEERDMAPCTDAAVPGIFLTGIGEDHMKLIPTDTSYTMSMALDDFGNVIFDGVNGVCQNSYNLAENAQGAVCNDPSTQIVESTNVVDSTNGRDLTLARTSSILDMADSVSVESQEKNFSQHPWAPSKTRSAVTSVPEEKKTNGTRFLKNLSFASSKKKAEKVLPSEDDESQIDDGERAMIYHTSTVADKVPRKVYNRFDAAALSNASWQTKNKPRTYKANLSASKVQQRKIVSSKMPAKKPSQEDFMKELLQSAQKMKGTTLPEQDVIVSSDVNSVKSILKKAKYSQSEKPQMSKNNSSNSVLQTENNEEATKDDNTKIVREKAIMKKKKKKNKGGKQKHKSMLGVIKGKLSRKILAAI
jgi:hypothetical protein